MTVTDLENQRTEHSEELSHLISSRDESTNTKTCTTETGSVFCLHVLCSQCHKSVSDQAKL